MISEPTLTGLTGSRGKRLGVSHNSVSSVLIWSLFDCIQFRISSLHPESRTARSSTVDLHIVKYKSRSALNQHQRKISNQAQVKISVHSSRWNISLTCWFNIERTCCTQTIKHKLFSSFLQLLYNNLFNISAL